MNPKQSSITSLLMLGVLSATLIYLLIFFAFFYAQIGNAFDALRTNSLNVQAHHVAELVEKAEALSGDAGPGPADASLYSTVNFYQYIVRDASTGRVTLSSPGAFVDSFPVVFPAPGRSQAFSFISPRKQLFLGTAIRLTYGEHAYVIEIAQSEESIRGLYTLMTTTFFHRMSLFGIPFLFILMLVIALSIKLIMSPLTKALKEAQQISFSKPDIRLNDSTFPQEIRPLALAVNDALDRLENGIRSQKDFIANAAHELRTPLTILRAHVDLLEDKTVAARMRDDVDAMARLVSQLLDTARLEAPEPLEMHPVDLAEIIRAVSQSIWPLMVRDNRAFEVEGIDKPVMVIGNFDTLCRAVRNLLENALKYSPSGTPIKIRLSGASIVVTDSGKGIDAADRGRIFEKFSRRDMQQGSGAGLGLFIVRRIMRLHGGDVGVDDAPGGGASFTLSFPGP